MIKGQLPPTLIAVPLQAPAFAKAQAFSASSRILAERLAFMELSPAPLDAKSVFGPKEPEGTLICATKELVSSLSEAASSSMSLRCLQMAKVSSQLHPCG